MICAECLFVDPVNDLAILGTPDDQELCEQADLYQEFTEAAVPIRIREAKKGETIWDLNLNAGVQVVCG